MHPNKEDPRAWRAQDKVLKEQKYFYFSRYGSKELAHVEAKKCQHDFGKRRQARALRLQLDMNQLFDENGAVRGLGVTRTNGQVLLKAQCTLDRKQVSTTRTLHNRSVREAFESLVIWLAKAKGVELTHDLNRMSLSAFRTFEIEHKAKLSEVGKLVRQPMRNV
ncbi:hypothetical protein PQE20_27095 (plasmid) [Vibrio harveyi]|uniref:hypothetical protein n=1 Tax=Vibrio harveyi TaxID=669 RepID=UPI00234D652A|nr:hypothetical protein [Vibrio harveyi]WCP84174.1 hypothetical protein PQE20_27095 [Vibrio harveyi]